MQKKILITGATGFIGNFLVKEALQRNYDIYATIRKTNRKKGYNGSNIKYVELDLLNIASFEAIIPNLPVFDYIIHNAGLTQAKKNKDYDTVNNIGTQKLIQALQHNNKLPGKFCYVSSLAAYGPGDPITLNPITLDSLPRPVTHYGKSKLDAETFIKQSTIKSFIIIRPTAVYGPGEKNIFESIRLSNLGFFLKIGLKPQFLTFIYVKDLSRLIFELLESDLKNKEYFASDGRVYREFELKNIIASLLFRKVKQISIPVIPAKFIGAISELANKFKKEISPLNIEKINELAANNWKCDIKPLEKDIKYKAEYNLEKGMAETIAWYKKQAWLK